ncbi:hypothetical protein Mucpa_5989 [Mucilaginibacter paludis DSM 18603]|uniref:Uncharacterized protein n=1 Tax=Mucilaginibacter paludis DSM 18603 TaxID=714943 RepID=H1YB15_9SPHI|nr:hypothetical protein Mucpa_5989 [Mucilaginibacter paludis DSM 18603]
MINRELIPRYKELRQSNLQVIQGELAERLCFRAIASSLAMTVGGEVNLQTGPTYVEIASYLAMTLK